MLRVVCRHFRRILPVLIGVFVLAAGNLQPASADGDHSAVIAWSDVTPVARYRNEGDWLVDIGRLKPEDVYGPLPGKAYKVGDTETFNALNFQGPSYQIRATLKLVTDHAYWWFEEGTDPNPQDLQRAGERFENDIRPLDNTLFGQEWTPGIDGDPHTFILHQKEIGGYAVGVFSPKDECPIMLCPHSNQHEMLYIGLDFGPVGSPQELTVIAHEYQHLIQFNNDGDEQRWLDEGLAQLAEHLNGFNPHQIANSNLLAFLHFPNFQLNSWPDRADIDPGVNYATGYIFSVYLYQRFGSPFIEHLARSKYKGLAAVDETLKALNVGESLDDVFMDWAVTNYVNDPHVGDGRYSYQSLRLPRQASSTDMSLGSPQDGMLHEYGADYLDLSQGGSYSLSFQGDTTVKLSNATPTSGKWMWWSYNEPHGAAHLEREFDLTNAKKPVLTYNAWWDLTQDYGRVYVEVSTDSGQTWTPIDATSTRHCDISDDPCYLNHSQGWEKESLDLSFFAGQKIRVRFDYLTDGATPGSGFFLDDIRLPAIGFADNVETDQAGWSHEGFMRVTNDLPQHWSVSVVSRTDPQTILPVKLDARNSGRLNFKVPDEGAVLVITAMAPFVTTTSNYKITLRKN